MPNQDHFLQIILNDSQEMMSKGIYNSIIMNRIVSQNVVVVQFENSNRINCQPKLVEGGLL